MKIGYACISSVIENKTTRKLTVSNYNEEKISSLINENISDLLAILKYNNSKKIELFRISSDIIPLGSHEINTFPWMTEFKSELNEIGQYILDNNLRVSMHPGQYTIINSPKSDVVERSILDLSYHCNFLDSLGIPESHKIILHVGGAYGDKESAIKRFISTYNTLPENIKKRLVIENDERFFSIYDLFKINEQIGIPLIFDNLHYYCYGDESMDLKDVLSKVKNTWSPKDGHMKIHYSQQDITKKTGAHNKTTVIEEFLNFLRAFDFNETDIMLEVKDKDISTIKAINTLNYLQNKKTSTTLADELNSYELYILEKDGLPGFKKATDIANTDNFLDFYNYVDSMLHLETTEQNLKLALNKGLSLIRNELNNKELNHYSKLYKEGSYEKCKDYLGKLNTKHQSGLREKYYLK